MAENPYRHVGEQLLLPAGPDLWPVAMIYFNNKTKGLTAAVASVAAELIVGHGKKIGAHLENEARKMAQRPKLTPQGPKRRA